MLSKIEKMVDKDALEEIMENVLTDMEETGVSFRTRRARHLYFMLSFDSGGGWSCVNPL